MASFNPFQIWEGGEKKRSVKFFPATSEKSVIGAQNFLFSSFTPFNKLL